MYQALYRSFRPEVFENLIGQEHIVKILENQLKTGTTGHAYLFCGTRGTGKTTTARLLAKGLNCTSEGKKPCGCCENCKAIADGNFLDVVEIDAASNNGVDDVRILREEVNYPPVLGKNKVYIIDEAHMLTNQACNALLKTLEEPPKNTVFILATTDPAKLPATILSRCIRLDFKRVSEEKIKNCFSEICKKIGVEAEEEALKTLASCADGSVRDGLSLLDRCCAGSKRITKEDVLFLLGMSDQNTYLQITQDLLNKDIGAVLSGIATVLSEGKEIIRFTQGWIEHLRNLLIVKYVSKPKALVNLSEENIARLKPQAEKISLETLRFSITTLSKALLDARYADRQRILIELAVVEICTK